jgi:hypothetical protein
MKRKFDSNVNTDLASEKAKGLKVLDNVLKHAGGAGPIDSQKAARIGQTGHERANREARMAGGGSGGAKKGPGGGKKGASGGKGYKKDGKGKR